MTFSIPEIEQALVSAAMQWPEPTFRVIDQFKITSEFFQTPQNRLIFNTLDHFYRDGKPLDLIAFTDRLRELGLLENVGGAFYITQTWCNCCYSESMAPHYCEMLEAAHAKLAVYKIAKDSIAQAEAPGCEAEDLIPSTITALEEIPVGAAHRKQRTFKEMVLDRLARLQGTVPDIIIPTGLTKLDENSPLYPSDMPVIAGARKSGKTVLALTLTVNLARRGMGVVYFSLEDREDKIMERLTAAVARVSVNRKHESQFSAEEAARMQNAVTELSSLPIFIRDEDHTLSQITSTIRELKAREKIKAVVVDYAQIVSMPDTKETNREQQVATVSRTFRRLAMQEDVVVFLLSQLNKEGQTRESMSLEQDCTAMWILEPVENEPNIRAFRVPFQRNGPSNIFFKVTFLGEVARVENYIAANDNEA